MIKYENIEIKYGDFVAIDNLNLDIREGEFFTFLGPSGCGKTTSLRALVGFLTPSKGKVYVGDKDVTNLPVEKRNIGMVFQSYELFPHLTVMDNILLAPCKVLKKPREEVREEARALLGRVGLLEKQDQYPRQLSGGQKQRVAIVRALCMHPEILLFDEPTSALDPQMVGEVLEVMRTLAKDGLTMIIVTHEMAFARDVAKHVIFMGDGVIVEEGTSHQIFEDPQKEQTKEFLSRFRNS